MLSNLVHYIRDAENLTRILGFSVFALLGCYIFAPFTGRIQFSIIFFAVVSAIALLQAIKGKPLLPFLKSQRWNLAIIGLYLLAGTFQAVYFYIFFSELSYEKLGDYSLLEYVLAMFNVVICLHLTWYRTGWPLTIVACMFLAYAFLGFLVPGPFWHTGLTLTEMLTYISLLMMEGGVYGIPLQVSVTIVAVFALLATIGQVSGLLAVLLKISWRIANRSIKLVPQFGVLSSMAFSTITGSAMANVAATGSFTIPLMKSYGIRPERAAGVEVAASTGGQVMPPVMGACAFLMAELLGVHYIEIMKAGLPLAIIIYVGIFLAVHLAVGHQVQVPVASSGEEGEKAIYKAPISRSDLFHLFSFVAAVMVIIAAYAVYDLSILYGGFFGILFYVALELVYIMATGFREQGVQAFLRWIKLIYEGSWRTAHALVVMCIMAGAVGIMMKVMFATGASQVMASHIVKFAGGQFIPLVVLSAVLGIFLGIVSVTIAAYIIVAVVVAPVFAQFGISPFVSHWFAFLVALSGPVTPPLGGGLVVASGISGAGIMRVGWETVKIGALYFFLPFIVISHPELLAFNLDTLVVFPLVLFSILCMVVAANLNSQKAEYPLRFILFVAAAASGLVTEGFYLWLSLGVSVLVASFLLYRHRKSIGIS